MRLSRRTLLGVAVTGGSLAVIGTMPLGVSPAVAATQEALILVDPTISAEEIQETRKALGVSGPTVRVEGPEALAEAAQWLAAAPGRRVAGLLADSDGILFQQMVPRGSALWLSSTHHTPPAALMSFVVAG